MTRRKAGATALTLAATISLVGTTNATADVVRDCSGGGKIGPVYWGDFSVRNTSCSKAKGALRNGSFGRSGPKVPHWNCRMIGTYYDGGIYRCTQSNRAMRFKAGG